MKWLKSLSKNLPTLLTAVALAVAVWILAVTNTDPVVRRNFNRQVEIEIAGLDTALVITSDIPEQLSIVLSAPESVWQTSLTTTGAVRAVADLSGLETGRYEVPVTLQINARPVKIESQSPETIIIELDKIYSESFKINLIQPSSPAVGYEAGEPKLSAQTATVSGPSSLVNQVEEVRAVLNISQAQMDIDRDLNLVALDENDLPVEGISISPDEVNVKQTITQRGGYRNVAVKVVLSGQQASGFFLKDYSPNPAGVTVFSTDPEIVNNLPGFIETQALNLTGANENFQVSLPLNMPPGVIVVGESTVTVNVSISPIQGSLPLTALTIEVIGLLPDYEAEIAPRTADVIISGPLPELDNLSINDVRVLIDLSGFTPGTYQVALKVEVDYEDLLVESILPAEIEVEIRLVASPTPES
jgi:YbbR domain-containing protein